MVPVSLFQLSTFAGEFQILPGPILHDRGEGLHFFSIAAMFHFQTGEYFASCYPIIDTMTACFISALIWWRKSLRPWLVWFLLSFVPWTLVLGEFGLISRFRYFPVLIGAMLFSFCLWRIATHYQPGKLAAHS